MKPSFVALGAGVLAFFVLVFTIRGSVKAAEQRLTHPDLAAPKVAIADQSEAAYCTPNFKIVLQRVLNACGLVGGEARRGCQPAAVKSFAQISDDDFNALFTPLKDRGAVVMFDEGSDKLDPDANHVIEERWLDRRGARYFFVVARASKTGTIEANRALSHRRANSVMLHLTEQLHDPDLDKQVGLMWLGNEFAQLSRDYCDWRNTRPDKKCDAEAVNRSAFVSWVDCRL